MLTATAHGRLGRDTELRFQPDGTAVADMAIGCNVGRKGQDGKTPTTWVKATLWGKQAEALAPYLTKGKGVVVTVSDMQVRTYAKNDGTQGVSLEGRVAGMEFTGAGPREEPSQTPIRTPPAQRAAPPKQDRAAGHDYFADSIPF